MAAEEDPFAEFITQEPAGQGTYAQQASGDGTAHLQMLVESAQRQEQLLGKVCSLLAGLNDKVDRLAGSQDRLATTMNSICDQGAFNAAAQGMQAPGASFTGNAAPAQQRTSRGQIVGPPNLSGGPTATSSLPPTSASAIATPINTGPSAEENRLRMEEERRRIEEEGRRRAEEIARKREEDERRRREEAERVRLEQERKAEEERQKKAALAQKTSGLMSGLTEGGGGDLFGDDLKPKKKGGGLFDD